MPNEPKRLHTEEKAKALAAHLNREEANDADGWTYEATPYGRGFFIVKAYDENGELAGTL